jgi:hypothetical protein
MGMNRRKFLASAIALAAAPAAAPAKPFRYYDGGDWLPANQLPFPQLFPKTAEVWTTVSTTIDGFVSSELMIDRALTTEEIARLQSRLTEIYGLKPSGGIAYPNPWVVTHPQ